jgi:hypothetical protein
MKTITTLAATVALIAGVSMAAAQTPSKNMDSTSDKASSTQNNMTTTPGQTGSMQGQKVATGNGKFCVEKSAGGGWDCKYATMASCEKDAKPSNRQCQPNPNMGTTGSKM